MDLCDRCRKTTKRQCVSGYVSEWRGADNDVDVVFLAGYMKKLGPLVLRAFAGRILNTHPALLPRFGGPGMYGDRVFEAVLEAGEAESGVSIHLVDADYDTGAIVRQCRVPVFWGRFPRRSEGPSTGTREGIRGRNAWANCERRNPPRRGCWLTIR